MTKASVSSIREPVRALFGLWPADKPQMVRRDFGARRASGGGSRGVNRSASCTAPASGSGKRRRETRAWSQRGRDSAVHAGVMRDRVMSTTVILLAVLGIGSVWLLTLGLCFSVRRSDEQRERSELPTRRVVLRAVPPQAAHDRRRTERRGSQERRGRPTSRDGLTG